jgi:O-acetyl-ADP-ribose deacetylase (regulator of RNase III)
VNGIQAARVEVESGDLLTQDVEAIVSPANEQLHNAGGLALAISQAAGPEFDADCKRLAPVCTGSAKVGVSGNLAQGSTRRNVINAVGPIWADGMHTEASHLLAAVHCAIVRVASEAGLRTVALPAISTGIFGYPAEQAAPVAVGATLQALTEYPTIELVRFVALDREQEKLALYQAALTAALSGA